jgi:hypothetical protein
LVFGPPLHTIKHRLALAGLPAAATPPWVVGAPRSTRPAPAERPPLVSVESLAVDSPEPIQPRQMVGPRVTGPGGDAA